MKETGASVTDCKLSLVGDVCGGRTDGGVTGCGVAQWLFWGGFAFCLASLLLGGSRPPVPPGVRLCAEELVALWSLKSWFVRHTRAC